VFSPKKKQKRQSPRLSAMEYSEVLFFARGFSLRASWRQPSLYSAAGAAGLRGKTQEGRQRGRAPPILQRPPSSSLRGPALLVGAKFLQPYGAAGFGGEGAGASSCILARMSHGGQDFDWSFKWGRHVLLMRRSMVNNDNSP
jgi:hypothetical protein